MSDVQYKIVKLKNNAKLSQTCYCIETRLLRKSQIFENCKFRKYLPEIKIFWGLSPRFTLGWGPENITEAISKQEHVGLGDDHDVIMCSGDQGALFHLNIIGAKSVMRGACTLYNKPKGVLGSLRKGSHPSAKGFGVSSRGNFGEKIYANCCALLSILVA